MGCLYFDQRLRAGGRGCLLYGQLHRSDFLLVGGTEDAQRGVYSQSSDTDDEMAWRHSSSSSDDEDSVIENLCGLGLDALLVVEQGENIEVYFAERSLQSEVVCPVYDDFACVCFRSIFISFLVSLHIDLCTVHLCVACEGVCLYLYCISGRMPTER